MWVGLHGLAFDSTEANRDRIFPPSSRSERTVCPPQGCTGKEQPLDLAHPRRWTRKQTRDALWRLIQDVKAFGKSVGDEFTNITGSVRTYSKSANAKAAALELSHGKLIAALNRTMANESHRLNKEVLLSG